MLYCVSLLLLFYGLVLQGSAIHDFGRVSGTWVCRRSNWARLGELRASRQGHQFMTGVAAAGLGLGLFYLRVLGGVTVWAPLIP